ncbi:hypothetical protein HKX48_006904 [Thoreauomyces humboldtii]|nr:hypothetical protein HKX48_006904 [Thoreauomyces humboldtii]
MTTVTPIHVKKKWGTNDFVIYARQPVLPDFTSEEFASMLRIGIHETGDGNLRPDLIVHYWGTSTNVVYQEEVRGNHPLCTFCAEYVEHGARPGSFCLDGFHTSTFLRGTVGGGTIEHDSSDSVRDSLEWVGVRNGLIRIPTISFRSYEDVDEELASKSVRSYMDCDLTIAPHGSVSTPNVDTLLTSHMTPDIAEYMLAMFGRTMHPPDKLEIFFLLYGWTRTGKSTLLKLIDLWHHTENSAVLNQDGEAVFGIGGKENKTIFLIRDMPANMDKTIAGSTVQSMISGEGVDVRHKNKESDHTCWKGHLATAGNRYPDWPNTGNAMALRMVVFSFVKIPEQQDRGLADSILEDEAANILWRSLHAYKRLLVEDISRRQGFYNVCPPYFIATRKDYEIDRDPHVGFIELSEDLLTDKKAGITWIIRKDVKGKTLWKSIEHVYAVYSKNLLLTRSVRTSPVNPCLPVWSTIAGGVEHDDVHLTRDCQSGAPHLCRQILYKKNKRDLHGQTKATVLVGALD